MKIITALRSALYDVLIFSWTMACSVPAFVLTLLPWRMPIVYWAQFWLHVNNGLERTVLGLSHVVEGRENLPPPPYIAAVQHQSAWETFKLLLWFPDAAVVMKAELLRMPLWGACVRQYGCIPVARSKKVEDLKKFLAAAHTMADAKRPIVLFPQGTRTTEKGAPFNKGVAVLQKELNLPVVPVTLNSGKFWGRNAFLKHSGTITVRVHPPIAPGLSREELLQKLRDLFENA